MWEIVNVVAAGLIVAYAIAMIRRIANDRRLRQSDAEDTRTETSSSDQ
jgi:hypothetical protein